MNLKTNFSASVIFDAFRFKVDAGIATLIYA